MLITNFASGELSPSLSGRIDLQQYYQAAMKIENFEIIPTGGIRRRAGSKRLAKLNDIDKDHAGSRLIPFILDKDAVFIFAFEEKKITVYSVKADHSVHLEQEIVTEYASMAEINQIQYAQNYDTMIFCHRNYKPYIMKYDFQTHKFNESYMAFDIIPDVQIDDDFDFVMIANGALPIATTTADGHLEFTYYKGENRTLTTKSFNIGVEVAYCVYNGKLWEYTKSGKTWTESGVDPESETDLFTAVTKRPGSVAFFDNRLFFAGTIAKPQAVYASATPDTTKTRYNDFNLYKKYITVNRVVKDADIHTFTCDVVTTNIDRNNNRTTLTNVTQDFTQTGTLEKAITNYFISGSKIPVGTKVLSCTANTIVINTALNITENITGEVMTIQLWKSANMASAEDYEYTIVNRNVTTADCGFYFEIGSDENDAIKFISTNKFLAIGTESSIWSVPGGVNALSIGAEMQGRFGSDDIQGMAVAQATIYFAQGKKGIREFYYDSAAEAFNTNNIAILAEHLLRESRIVDFDYVSNPYSKIICTRNDGVIVSMLYDKTNGVMGWNRLTRQVGKIVSTATTRGADESDYIFMAVEDNGSRYLEMIDPSSDVYLDSWSEYTAPDTAYSSKAVLYNVTTGKTCSTASIPGGFITTGDKVYIGYPIRSYIKSMPVMANDPNGKKRITHLLVRFIDSWLPLLKVTGLPDEKFSTITQRPYSGVANITYPGSSDRDVYFELETQDVYPVNILAVNANLA